MSAGAGERPERQNPAPSPCEVSRPTATFSIAHRTTAPRLNIDPNSPAWRDARSAWIGKDCSPNSGVDYPDLKTEVRGFWTDGDLYLLFACPYSFPQSLCASANRSPAAGLWDRDVVEMFLGDDWDNIRHYREFEIAPTGDWIDLAIDLDCPHAARMASSWQTTASIDEPAKIWYAACRIPLRSVTEKEVGRGRAGAPIFTASTAMAPIRSAASCAGNPTCVKDRDPNHVPENFGTLVFEK